MGAQANQALVELIFRAGRYLKEKHQEKREKKERQEKK